MIEYLFTCFVKLYALRFDLCYWNIMDTRRLFKFMNLFSAVQLSQSSIHHSEHTEKFQIFQKSSKFSSLLLMFWKLWSHPGRVYNHWLAHISKIKQLQTSEKFCIYLEKVNDCNLPFPFSLNNKSAYNSWYQSHNIFLKYVPAFSLRNHTLWHE